MMTTAGGESVAQPSRRQPLVLGVDGGGTKTRAWLAEVDNQASTDVIGRGVAGSTNQVAVGWEAALQNLADSVGQAFADAGLMPAPIANAVFALAGSGTEEARQSFLDYAERALQIQSAQVIHDGQAVLQAGTPSGWGIALIAGTGAVAYGMSPTRATAVVGGWGYWFGDEGSGYWVGQSALRAVSQAADGRAGETALTAAVLSRLQIQQPREIVAALARRGDVRHEIAQLAELVCEAAQNHDGVAEKIVAAAAEHWSRHIQCLARQLKLDQQFPLALAGGVLGGSLFARNRLLRQLDADQLSPAAVEFVAEPVAGCVQLACAHLNSALR